MHLEPGVAVDEAQRESYKLDPVSEQERGPEAELETNYSERKSKIWPACKTRDCTYRYTYSRVQERACGPGLSLSGVPDEWVQGVLMEIPGEVDKVSSGLLVSSGPLTRETARVVSSTFSFAL